MFHPVLSILRRILHELCWYLKKSYAVVAETLPAELPVEEMELGPKIKHQVSKYHN